MTGQTADNQLLALRVFAHSRWVVAEYVDVDHGVSGAREQRPALDQLLAAARARRVDVIACTKLDRLARSVHHLVAMVREFQVLGVDLVVLDQAIDSTTPAGRLLFHLLAAIAEFERDLIRDLVAGLRRARARGVRVGRPRRPVDVLRAKALLADGQSLRQVAKSLGVPVATLHRAVSEPSLRRAGQLRDTVAPDGDQTHDCCTSGGVAGGHAGIARGRSAVTTSARPPSSYPQRRRFAPAPPRTRRRCWSRHMVRRGRRRGPRLLPAWPAVGNTAERVHQALDALRDPGGVRVPRPRS